LRVAALALGVLAGLVASLILALGGLDVTADLGITADRQVQAIRFGLFLIGNLGIFAAALVLAAPLAGGILLILAAIAWAAAAILMHHTTDLVLITPPALLLLSAAFAIIAHVRRPSVAAVEEDDPDVEILSPAERGGLRAAAIMDPEDEDEVGVPAFAADPSRTGSNDWNPRKRAAPPPRAKPAFRPIEEEYDDEPSGFSRFAMGLSGFLSFGLYAALAGAAVLIFWNARNSGEQPTAVVAELPAISSEASSSEQPRLASSDETLTPILTGEPIRDVMADPTAPSASTSELLAEATTSSEAGTFGAVSTPEDPGAVPTLSDDFANAESSLPPVSGDPPSLPQESSEEPVPLGFDPPSSEQPSTEPVAVAAVEPTVVPSGMAWPRAVPRTIAAQRLAPGTGPTTVSTQPAPSSNNSTGL
jgi:hypothetical protein